jgi:hypothetical protein
MRLDTFGVRQQVLSELSSDVCYDLWVRISYSALSLSFSLAQLIKKETSCIPFLVGGDSEMENWKIEHYFKICRVFSFMNLPILKPLSRM